VTNFGASSEQVYTLCVWIGLVALWHGLRGEGWGAVVALALAGLFFGGAHLTRWEGAIYLFVGAAWAGWRILRGPRRVYAFIGLVIFVTGFALAAVPYASYLQRVQGTWFSSKGSTQQLQGQAVATDDPLAWERYYDAYEAVRDQPLPLSEWATNLWSHRDAELRLYLGNWFKQVVLPFQSLSFLAWLWAPLALIAVSRWKRTPRSHTFLLSNFAPLMLFPIAFVDPRYWLPLTPGLLIWAAHGTVAMEDWLVKRPAPPYGGAINGREHLSRLPFALLSFVFLVASVLGAFFVPAPIEYRALGEWMAANHIGQGEVIMARKRQVPFYAGARWEWLPLTDTTGLLERAAQRDAHYVVIDERLIPSLRPDLAYLLDHEGAPGTLELVTAMHVRGKRILLYRINDGQ
jgi:hypothetical protein